MESKLLSNYKNSKPPIAKRIDKILEVHEHQRNDPYFWLNERDTEPVLDYLKEENAYVKEVTKPLKEFEEALYEEMKARIKEDDSSVPYKDGNYSYFSRYIKGGEYPLVLRSNNKGEEEVILDGNKMAEGHDYFSLGGFEIADNEQLLAYGVDTLSRRNYTLKFKDLRTNTILEDEIENTEGGSYAWAADNKSIYYIVRDQQTLLGNKVYKHVLGTSSKEDVLVYEEKDEQFYMGLSRSKSKKYIFIASVQNGVSTEYQLINAEDHKMVTFLARKKGLEYYLSHHLDSFYIKTNKDNSFNYKICQANESNFADWQELIAHNENVLLEEIDVFKDFLIIQEREKGLVNLKVINIESNESYYLNFEEEAYDAYMGTNPDINNPELRFIYTSLTTPSTVYDFNLYTQEKIVRKQQAVLGSFKKENYRSKRIYVTARDGQKVPVSLVHHVDTKLDGTAPLLQYAYGSYGYSIDPTFSSVRLSLLDRGFVFAIAHIRGGQEMGRKWYDEGKLFKKKNTFTDFIDVTHHLIGQKLVDAKRVFAQGGSAGGLLMGVIYNLEPMLYKGILAAVPFVDVVTTMLDETIPLTTGEFEEWGNPKIKEYYDYMLSYSPYDNIKKQNYSNLLVTTGYFDSQVQYWEPAKWVAKLRKNISNDSLILFDTDLSSGHGGASGRFASLKKIALEYVFLLDLACD